MACLNGDLLGFQPQDSGYYRGCGGHFSRVWLPWKSVLHPRHHSPIRQTSEPTRPPVRDGAGVWLLFFYGSSFSWWFDTWQAVPPVARIRFRSFRILCWEDSWPLRVTGRPQYTLYMIMEKNSMRGDWQKRGSGKWKRKWWALSKSLPWLLWLRCLSLLARTPGEQVDGNKEGRVQVTTSLWWFTQVGSPHWAPLLAPALPCLTHWPLERKLLTNFILELNWLCSWNIWFPGTSMFSYYVHICRVKEGKGGKSEKI